MTKRRIDRSIDAFNGFPTGGAGYSMEEFKGLAYLAGPVRSPGRVEAIAMRASIERFLVDSGYATFNPAGAWLGDYSPTSEQALQRINDMVVFRCSLFAMIMHGDHFSAGTNAEALKAMAFGKHVWVFPINLSRSEAVARTIALFNEARTLIIPPVRFWLPVMNAGSLTVGAWEKGEELRLSKRGREMELSS